MDYLEGTKSKGILGIFLIIITLSLAFLICVLLYFAENKPKAESIVEKEPGVETAVAEESGTLITEIRDEGLPDCISFGPGTNTKWLVQFRGAKKNSSIKAAIYGFDRLDEKKISWLEFIGDESDCRVIFSITKDTGILVVGPWIWK